MRLVRRLWTEDNVTFHGEHFRVDRRPPWCRARSRGDRRAPAALLRRRLGGRRAGGRDRGRCPALLGRAARRRPRAHRAAQGAERELGRDPPRWSSGCGSRRWSATPPSRPGADAEAKVARWPSGPRRPAGDQRTASAVGQQRLLDLAARGDVLDDILYTAPGKFGGGGAGTTWLVGSAEDVARRCGSTRISASPTSCSPTRRTSGDPPSATSCCRCCATRRWSRSRPDPQAQRPLALRLLLADGAVALRGGGRRRRARTRCRTRGRTRCRTPSRTRCPTPEPDPRARRLVGRDHVLAGTLGQRLVVEQDLPEPSGRVRPDQPVGVGRVLRDRHRDERDVVQVGLAELVGQVRPACSARRDRGR